MALTFGYITYTDDLSHTFRVHYLFLVPGDQLGIDGADREAGSHMVQDFSDENLQTTRKKLALNRQQGIRAKKKK